MGRGRARPASRIVSVLLIALATLVGTAAPPTSAQRRSQPRPYLVTLSIEVMPKRDPQTVCVGETRELLVKVRMTFIGFASGMGLLESQAGYLPVTVAYSNPG